MNMLIDVLPTEVEIDGTWYCLNTDYRICIMFEMLMMDDTLDDTQKLRKALELFFGDVIPTNATSAVDKILWFYNCGKDMDQERKTRGQRAKKKVYDFDYDADYIYAAFLQQYGVDLQDEEIHWWKFKAMFKSLRDDTEFVKIMGYRSIQITNNMTKSQKEFYQNMKTLHALPAPRSESEKDRAIEEALKNGGDLSAFFGGESAG